MKLDSESSSSRNSRNLVADHLCGGFLPASVQQKEYEQNRNSNLITGSSDELARRARSADADALLQDILIRTNTSSLFEQHGNGSCGSSSSLAGSPTRRRNAPAFSINTIVPVAAAGGAIPKQHQQQHFIPRQEQTLMEASARLALQGAVCSGQPSNPKNSCFCNNSPRWPTYHVVVPLHLRVVPLLSFYLISMSAEMPTWVVLWNNRNARSTVSVAFDDGDRAYILLKMPVTLSCLSIK